jgi:hypothetical protein
MVYSNLSPKPTFFNFGEFLKASTIGQTYFAVPFQNSGFIHLASGRLNLPPDFQQLDGSIKLNGGSLSGPGKTPIRLIGGRVEGGGLITGDVVNEGGTMAPGFSPGTITINGNYTQTSTGRLDVEIGGTSPGSGYDQLIVKGNASLAGTINLIRWNNYLPPIGSSFKLITYYSVAGGFTTFNGLRPSTDRVHGITKAPSYFLSQVKSSTTASLVRELSPVRLSSADVAGSNATLVFTGALDAASAQDVSRYSVLVNDELVPVESASYSTATRSVTLELPKKILRSGAGVNIAWRGLLDAKGLPLNSETRTLTAR